jgi:hypothetical protein
VTRAVAARGAVSAAAVSAVGQRWAGLAAWSMAVAAGAALGLALAVERRQPAFDLSSALYGAAILCFAVVGAFVAQRRPANPLGWLFAAVGLLGLAQLASYQVAYATFGTGTVAVPGALWLGWYSSWAFPPVAALFVVVIPLLFPTGRPPSARAGHILTITAATVGVTSVAGMLRPWDRSAGGLLEDPDVVLANPVALEGAAWLGTVQELGMVVLGGMALATIAAMVGRYRRSGPIEKLQLKWFLYAVAVVVTYVIGSILGEGILGGDPPAVVFIIGPFFLAGVPISAAFAILRYRLYDIDRIISRTVAYTGVTAVLGAVYAGAVVLSGRCSPRSARALSSPWPPPPWWSPRCSVPCAARCSHASTGASIAHATTPSARSTTSPPACGGRSIWTSCPASSSTSSTWRWHPGRCSSGWRVSSDEGGRRTAIHHPVTLRGRFGARTHPTDIESKGEHHDRINPHPPRRSTLAEPTPGTGRPRCTPDVAAPPAALGGHSRDHVRRRGAGAP